MNWLSQTQQIVTLSSCESEYVSLGVGVQEILFGIILMMDWGICELPAISLEDNQGVIFWLRARWWVQGQSTLT